MRNYNIDILRGISILLVLLHHFNIPYKLHDTFLGLNVLGESLSTLIARNGNYGVTMFFVISGFLITQHTLKRHGELAQIKLKDFYVRRIARIIPCLVLLITMVTLLGSLGLKPFINQTPNDVSVSYALTVFSALTFWINILIIKYGWVNYALGVLWSLSVEEAFYLVFPVLCLALGRGKGFVFFLIAVICYAPYFRSLHFAEESGAYLYHYFSSFDGIAIGCLTALIWHKNPRNIDYYKKPFIVLIIALLCTLYLYAPIKDVSTWSISIFALFTAFLIFLFDQNPLQTVHSGVAKIFIWIGQRSYEMYLFHLIILGLFKVFYLPKETLASEKIILLPVFLMATFMLSWLIEKYYSSPLNLKIRDSFIKKDK